MQLQWHLYFLQYKANILKGIFFAQWYKSFTETVNLL